MLNTLTNIEKGTTTFLPACPIFDPPSAVVSIVAFDPVEYAVVSIVAFNPVGYAGVVASTVILTASVVADVI